MPDRPPPAHLNVMACDVQMQGGPSKCDVRLVSVLGTIALDRWDIRRFEEYAACYVFLLYRRRIARALQVAAEMGREEMKRDGRAFSD